MSVASPLIGAQALVDSTGKATDILRRVQVRVAIGDTDTAPSYAIESTTSICKRFGVVPPNIIVPDSLVTGDASCAIP